jgi:hypothetical protein
MQINDADIVVLGYIYFLWNVPDYHLISDCGGYLESDSTTRSLSTPAIGKTGAVCRYLIQAPETEEDSDEPTYHFGNVLTVTSTPYKDENANGSCQTITVG